MFASSFGAEDMVLIDLIARHAPAIGVFTLDTGRLPEETHALIDRARDRYGIAIDVYFPDAARLAGVRARRTASTRSTTASNCARTAARVRKTEPLRRALAGKARVDHRVCAAASR